MKKKFTVSDLRFMAQALQLAVKGRGQTSPNPLVGCVVVKNDRIIGQGFHKKCGGPHAEILALRQAGRAAQGATLYVTLEPCAHWGRTPPCVDAIVQSGAKRIVIAMKDPNPLTNGRSIKKLRKSGLAVMTRLLEEQAKKINAPFLKFIQRKMPFVVIKCAQTLDGKVATATGSSKWITGDSTRVLTHRMRDDFDAILVGINTVLKDDPYLNASRPGKRIKKIVVDSSLRIPLKGNLFKKTAPKDIIVATTTKAPAVKLRSLERRGIDVIVCPSAKGRIDLKALFKMLAKKEITSILVEGGARIVASVLQQKLADKVWFFIAPKILGDQKAQSSVQGLDIRDVSKAMKFKRVVIHALKDDIAIEGYLN